MRQSKTSDFDKGNARNRGDLTSYNGAAAGFYQSDVEEAVTNYQPLAVRLSYYAATA